MTSYRGGAARATDEGTERDTRSRLIAAALETFTFEGYDAVSIREVERRAGVNRGLVAYHFGSKEALWRASVDWLMARFHDVFEPYRHTLREVSVAERERVLWMVFARFCANHPQYFRLLLMEGAEDSDRTTWLVETHIRPNNAFYTRVVDHPLGEVADGVALAHFAWVGAVATISAVPGLCRALFGVDPRDERITEALVQLAARLGTLIPTLADELTADVNDPG